MNKTTTDPYKAACKLLGKKPRPALKDRSDKDKVSEDAFHRLIICIRAKNLVDGKEWKPVYDGSEWHYWPLWYPAPSGVGLAFSYTPYWGTYTFVGARLEYRTRALAEEGAKEFDQYYQDYYAV